MAIEPPVPFDDNDEAFRLPPSSRPDGAPGSPTDILTNLSMINWSSHTDDPVVHVITVESRDPNGQHMRLHRSEKPATHAQYPYNQELDQKRPLIRHLRGLAMDPASHNHLIFLHSLQSAEEEIKERKGAGLVNFEEFSEHMRSGRLRFLESWMEWVSI